jgi:CHAT domain-containing protein
MIRSHSRSTQCKYRSGLVLTLKGPDAAKPDTYRTRLKTIRENVEELEAEFSSRSAAFRNQTQPVTLTAVQFAALVDERNQYLIERYSISYLTRGGDLLRMQTQLLSNAPPLVVANPDFGRFATIALRGGQNSGKLRARDRARAQIDPTQFFFQPLPASDDEALAIKVLLSQASLLRREDATEAALKQAKGPQILHIETHGFFIDYQEPSSEKDDSRMIASPANAGLASGKTASSTVQIEAIPSLEPATEPPSDLRLSKLTAQIKDPLLRSGLALAGANHGKSGDEDGIVTALEAASLDLSGTKLVVLSACDTGVGEVMNGEGAQGLRRALVLAGSESQVSDEATKDLMTPILQGAPAGRGAE